MAPRREEQPDRAPDRLPDDHRVSNPEGIQEAGYRSVEELPVILGVRDVRKAVPGVVERIDPKGLPELRNHLLEQVEVSPQRVKKHEGGSVSRHDVAEANPIHANPVGREAGVPLERIGRLRRAAQRLDHEGDQVGAGQHGGDHQQGRGRCRQC
jgi:hypothetical protein